MMYQLHFKPATGCYCLRRDEKRTHWLSSILQAISAHLFMPVGPNGPIGCILLYEGPTIPTQASNPELFL